MRMDKTRNDAMGTQSSKAEYYLEEQSTAAGFGGGARHSSQDKRVDRGDISIELGEGEWLRKIECYVGTRSDNAFIQTLGIKRYWVGEVYEKRTCPLPCASQDFHYLSRRMHATVLAGKCSTK